MCQNQKHIFSRPAACQVIDLSEVKPEVGLNLCKHLPTCKVLIAGGDGTVNWVLDAAERSALKVSAHCHFFFVFMCGYVLCVLSLARAGQFRSFFDRYTFQKLPPFSILPLGTGNDLSRTLGWGPGHTGPVDPMRVIRSLRHARLVSMDRWLISSTGVALRVQRTKHRRMSNYGSIGVDALVTFNFHTRRSRMPRVLSGRFVNKLLFFHYGTRDVIERACKYLSKRVTLYMDGRKMELPELEGLVFLNIRHWGAGVQPWALGGPTESGDGQVPEQSISDEMIEVFGLYSSFHIAQMQVGLSEPYRIGQASKVELVIGKGPRLPMQADGEPWLQGPGKVRITHLGTVDMLTANPDAPLSPPTTPSGFFFL